MEKLGFWMSIPFSDGVFGFFPLIPVFLFFFSLEVW